MAWPIVIGGAAAISIAQKDAERAIAGFAFGKSKVTGGWNGTKAGFRPAPPLDDAPSATSRYRWGYRTYDTVPTDPHRITIADVAITAAIDSQIGGVQLLQMEAVLEEISDALTRIPVHQTFWDLPAAAVNAAPSKGSSAWWIWRAWAIPMWLEEINVAITHKTLHRKRPWLFPMLDSNTAVPLGKWKPPGNVGPWNAWSTIHWELNKYATEFAHLEQWFAERAAERGGTSLTRLRIHDVLTWASLTGDLNKMIQAGRKMLKRSSTSRPLGSRAIRTE